MVNYYALTYAGDRATLADVERIAATRYALVHGDVADARRAGRHRGAPPRCIVNFAAESHNSRAVLDSGTFVRTNVLGTQVLLDAAREAGVGRFHQVSTCEGYGDLALDGYERFAEDAPYRPRTPYNASKAAADLSVRAFGAGSRRSVAAVSSVTGAFNTTLWVLCDRYAALPSSSECVAPGACARHAQRVPRTNKS